MAVELESMPNMKELAAALLCEMNQQKASQTPSISMKEFAAVYLERHAKAHNKTWKDDESRLRLHILPVLGERQLCEIKTAEIVQFQSSMVQKGVDAGRQGTHQANRCTELLGHIFRQARSWGYFPEEKRLPTEGVKSFRELSRERFVDSEEMERLAAELNRVQSKRMRVLLWLHLLTGMRTTELRELKWCELDEANQQLNKSGRDIKNWKPVSQPLSQIALSLLAGLPQSGVYIFSEEGAAKPYNRTSVYKVWNRVRKRANLPDVRIHDLRRTVGSWLAQSGVPMALIAKVLNHSDMRATEIYARFANADVRAVLESHSNAIGPQVNMTQLIEEKAASGEKWRELRQTTVPFKSVPTILQAINQVRAPHLRAYFWLHLLTGLNQREMLGAKWSDFDDERLTLSIPAERSYSRKPIEQPLSKLAVEKLAALPKHSPYIFSAPGWRQPVSDHVIRQSWDGVRRRAKLPHLEISALKTTAIELLKDLGTPPDLVTRTANKKPRIPQEQRKYTTEEIREALEQLSEKIIWLTTHSGVIRLDTIANPENCAD